MNETKLNKALRDFPNRKKERLNLINFLKLSNYRLIHTSLDEVGVLTDLYEHPFTFTEVTIKTIVKR